MITENKAKNEINHNAFELLSQLGLQEYNSPTTLVLNSTYNNFPKTDEEIYNKISQLQWKNIAAPKTLYWKSLTCRDKYLLLGCFIEPYGSFQAWTLCLSPDFIKKARASKNPSDWIRRRLSTGLKNHLGFIPDFTFVIENADARIKMMHLHGIIDTKDVDEDIIRDSLKSTVFGIHFKKHAFNNFCWKIQKLYTPLNWQSYCLKNKYVKKGRIYISNTLKNNLKQSLLNTGGKTND